MTARGSRKWTGRRPGGPGTLKMARGGTLLATLTPPGPPGLLPGLFLDPLAVHQTTLSYSLFEFGNEKCARLDANDIILTYMFVEVVSQT